MIPKTFSEEDLKDTFKVTINNDTSDLLEGPDCEKTNACVLCVSLQEYGDIEYCVIIKNKSTGESKGLGYVRYYKPSQAAQAIENCDKGTAVTNSCFDWLEETTQPFNGDYGGGDDDFVASLQSHSGRTSHKGLFNRRLLGISVQKRLHGWW